MKKLLEKINLWPLVLAAVTVGLCIANYTPDTWLSGWDTLHPEFNFVLYFKRIFWGIWQEHQGLGALATQAHASEIPRMLVYYPLSFIFPDNFLRYSYFFLTLIVGSLGIFYFLREVLFKNSKKNVRNLASFSGGLFYLLNLGTLQQYCLPLEMFATHFASLPWLFLFVSKIIEDGRRKNWLVFLIITFFSAPIAHTQTLFYAYFLGLTVFLFGYLIKKRDLWKKCLAILGLTIAVNSFWFLPHLYFVFTSGNIVQDSKISSMFSETAFLTGQKFGNLKDTLFLKNYLFEWGKYDSVSDRFVRLFGEWNPHLARPEVIVIRYLLAGMVLVGLFWSIKNKKNQGLPVLGMVLVSFLLIANDAPILRGIYEFLQNTIPLFKEALRFPYTKFSILLMFSQAVFFGVFWEKTAEKVLDDLKRFKEKETIFNLMVLITAVLIYVMWPAFEGGLINKDIRVKFPPEYFSAMEYLNSQESERIALLPIHQYWGWIYHDWGYEGAGFEWFGLNSPLLDREFDRWNPYNEQFYWEASYAVYSKNLTLLENILEKYQVRWLIVDESAINPAAPKALFLDELEELLGDKQYVISDKKEATSETKKFELVKIFGKIKIYKVNLETPAKDFVYLAEDLPVINSYSWNNLDRAYLDFSNYVSQSSEKLRANSEELKLKTENSEPKYLIQNTKYDVYYPFRSLFTGRKTNELEIEIEDLGDRFVFKKKIPESAANYQIEIPEYDAKELVEINQDPVLVARYFIPTVEKEDEEISVVFPKVSGLLSTEIDPTTIPEVLEAKNCNQFGNGKVISEKVIGDKGSEKEVLRLTAEDANNCSANFYLPDLPHKYSYLISAETKNISGKPLLFWLENLTNRKADLEVYLEEQPTTNSQQPTVGSWKLEAGSRVVQPPMAEDGLGYTLHFDNISIGREKTVNELGKIEVYPIPYEFLTGLNMVKREADTGGVKLSDLRGVKVNHPNTAVYEIEMTSEEILRLEPALSEVERAQDDKVTLVLSQAYHEGWKAYEMSNFLRASQQLPIFKQLSNFQFLKQNLPFLFGEKLEHVKVNNWENGWQLVANNNQQPTTNNQQLEAGSWKSGVEKQVVFLVFWPQYLEYAGFGLMAISFLIVILVKE